MVSNGVGTQVQFGGDRSVRPAVRQTLRDVGFPAGETKPADQLFPARYHRSGALKHDHNHITPSNLAGGPPQYLGILVLESAAHVQQPRLGGFVEYWIR